MPRKHVILAKDAPGYVEMHRTNVQLPKWVYQRVMDALLERRYAAVASKSKDRPAMSFNGWVNEAAIELIAAWKK